MIHPRSVPDGLDVSRPTPARIYDYMLGGHSYFDVDEVAALARARPWWRDFGEIFDNDFPGYENDAASIRVYMPLVLPGLLQTQAYMEALLKTGPRSPAFRRKTMADLSQAAWRKASMSVHNGGCVEVAANIPDVTAVRDGERPDDRAHVVDRAAFASFLEDVKGGRYDL